MKIAFKIKAKHGELQKFIDEMGWTQSDFARKIKCTISLVGEWFNLKNFPRNPNLMERVCSLVGKTAEELFPEFLKNPEFLKLNKQITKYREVDIEYLAFNQLSQIPYNPTIINEIVEKELKEKIDIALKTLTPREEKIIKERFGLDDGDEKTLETVGNNFKISRERVREIEVKALRKLRQPIRSKILKVFLNN